MHLMSVITLGLGILFSELFFFFGAIDGEPHGNHAFDLLISSFLHSLCLISACYFPEGCYLFRPATSVLYQLGFYFHTSLYIYILAGGELFFSFAFSPPRKS